ncbi:uncharacterized protein LOC121727587 [Aricia agestis]|uniref:uncharacterized protein LOC121727587 n=1 Tax=Aricia agestis TaxID=91739 RepID=UPI001C202E5B|nr:uncharacterized protein LOC121727587 [Aricia agestis]
MSLLQNLPYPDYKQGLALNVEQCEVIARLANLPLNFNDVKKPGEFLIKQLDKKGYSVSQYKKFLTTTLNNKAIFTYYKPQSKVAILIANDKYEHLSKLATPSIDCDSLASKLKVLGFIPIVIKNVTSCSLKGVLKNIISLIPKDSYCFIFYAGHGCELCNTKCILGIDCPAEDIEFEHVVTENWILREVAKCEPDLCILIMDMCRLYLDKNKNQTIYASLSCIEEYSIYKNLIIGYSTQSSEAAYEVLEIECSTTIDNNLTYELKPGDTEKISPCASQYVDALCTRLSENLHINVLFDKVHLDVEKSLRKQKPIKVQCGVFKRSLYDPVQGDETALIQKIKEKLADIDQNCTIYYEE